jgi:hypothetical protein
MRSTVEFSVVGDTIEDVLRLATGRWRTITGDIDADLPSDTELHMRGENEKMTALFTIRAKIEGKK